MNFFTARFKQAFHQKWIKFVAVALSLGTLIISPTPVLAGLDDLKATTVANVSGAPDPAFKRTFGPSEFVYPLCPKKNVGCLYVDDTATPVSGAVFDEVRAFSESGVAPVRIADKWGYITKQGTWLFEPQFDEGEFGFHDGHATVRKGGKWGLVSTDGTYTVDLIADKRVSFANGLARVVIDGKTGFMDTSGNWVIQPTLWWALDFDKYGYAIARIEDDGQFGFMEGMIDRSGKWVVAPKYLDVEGIQQNGLIRTRTFNGSWGVLNLHGDWVVPPKYLGISEFDAAGQATVRTHADDGKKLGIIDTKGRWIMRPEHVVSGPFAPNGLAAASVGYMHGFINKSNEWVINPVFNSAGRFAGNGLANAAIKLDNGTERWGFINASGAWVIPPKFDFARHFSQYGVAVVSIRQSDGTDLYGQIDALGHYVFEPILDRHNDFWIEPLASAGMNGDFGLLDPAGNWVVPPIYDSAETIGNLVKVSFGDFRYQGYLTRDGTPLGDLAARFAAANNETTDTSGLQSACDAGDGIACVGLYHAHLVGIDQSQGHTTRGEKAIKALTAACAIKETNMAEACFMLGRHNYLGDISKPNIWDALRNFNRSCRLGNAEACVNAADGVMRRLSKFKDRDSAEIGKRGLAFLEQACSRSHAEGCHKLGLFHAERKYIQSEPNKAGKFLELACEFAPAEYCN